VDASYDDMGRLFIGPIPTFTGDSFTQLFKTAAGNRK